MVKSLIIGDMHIQPSNIVQIENFLSELKIYLKSNTFDFIVSAGDLLHTHERLHTIALNKAIEFIDILSKNAITYVLVGNHDLKTNQEFMTDDGSWLTCLHKYPNVKIINKAHTCLIKNMLFTFCPYVPDSRFVEALNTCGEHWKKSKCVFGHQTLDGAKMGSIIAENVEEWKSEYPLCVSGHIHTRQQVKPNLLYVGSSLQHSFGETDKKSLTKIDFDTNEITESYLNLPTKKTLYIDAKDIKEFDIDKLKKNNNIEYKIVVQGDASIWKSFQKSVKYKKILCYGKIIFKSSQKTYDIDTSTHLKTVESFKDVLRKTIIKESDKKLIELINELQI